MIIPESPEIMGQLPLAPGVRLMGYRERLLAAARRVESMTHAEWLTRIPAKSHALTKALRGGAWKGSPCFIVGGGPSLKGFEFGRLKGRLSIAVNRAFEVVPSAAILFSMDSLYYRWALQHPETSFSRFRGLKVWLDTYGFPYEGVHLVKSAGPEGLSGSLENGLYHGNNSGYAALNLAVCLGANPIYLLGFDLNAGARGLDHFHSGYPMKTPDYKVRRYIENFMRLAPMLKERGVDVVNLSPCSALECFGFASIDEVLR